MFELNGNYENRIGPYTVRAINGPKMTVRYADGTEADLNMNIQMRIWENIVAEKEAKSASRKRAARTKRIVDNTKHYIKVISIPPGEELMFPGWEEHVVLIPENEAQIINKGDRLIFYALEARTFFAVATITGDIIQANPKKYTFTLGTNKADFYQIDIDTAASKLENSVELASIELESIPNFGQRGEQTEAFYLINEDDFELLAEALTEVSEDEEEDIDDDFDDEEEDE